MITRLNVHYYVGTVGLGEVKSSEMKWNYIDLGEVRLDHIIYINSH